MRRSTKPKVKFEGAHTEINILECAVMRQMVQMPLCIEDVADALWAPEYITVLRAAFPYLGANARQNTREKLIVFVPTQNDLLSVECWLTLDLDGAHLPQPIQGLANFRDTHEGRLLRDVCTDIAKTVFAFNQVRTVVDWLEDHATVAAARWYFPTMCALVPADHEIHRLDGGRYREPSQNIAAMIPLMRQAATTIAGAKFAPREYPRHTTFTVTVTMPRGASQSFGLL